MESKKGLKHCYFYHSNVVLKFSVMIKKLLSLAFVGAALGIQAKSASHSADRPNILFVISDDQSYPHASAYGCKWIKTPNFDRIASQGILFTNAFVTSPGCSPSRASILTGRYPWQNEEAGTHGSTFPTKYKVFTQVLAEHGYAVGFTGKPWAPGDWKVSGWNQNPVGPEYNKKKLATPYTGISKVDYSGNFDQFLAQRKPEQPFFFWFGANEPHRPYEQNSGDKEGKEKSSAIVPGFLPDHPIVRGDLLDYAVEIEWYDKQLGKMLSTLEQNGELENTLIIITADNGMSFPRAKANCYEAGLHVPLAICWANKVASGQVSNDLISTVDLAPTILESVKLKFDGKFPMSGTSMLKQLVSPKFKMNKKEAIFAGRERHTNARYNNQGYPQRVIRTAEYLYIRNFHSDLWPAGDPQVYLEDGILSGMHQAYLDIDPGPTHRLYGQSNTQDPAIAPFFLAAIAKRPAEELYQIVNDKDCLINIALDPKFSEVKNQLSDRLMNQLRNIGDTRIMGPNPDIWESYPRYKGTNPNFPAPTKD